MVCSDSRLCYSPLYLRKPTLEAADHITAIVRREHELILLCFLISSLLYHSIFAAQGTVSPTIKTGVSKSMNKGKIISYRHALRPILLMSIGSVKLAVNTNHRKGFGC